MKSVFPVFLTLCCVLSSTGQQLYVGANYHPHDDKNTAKIERDIRLMKAAGFTIVRMGHLAWDSYEPLEGHFDFGWFDNVMDLMDKAGIKVILDIAVRPAPIWLHRKYPSIDVTDAGGHRLYPNHRYMEDVGVLNYQRYALRYADSLTRHYGSHPALLAFGIDNESGDGPISYSETVRQRFIDWLRRKYNRPDSLNRAWATQRWSRRIGDFEETGLPVSGDISGAPERMLDFRRFISDEVSGFLLEVIDKVNSIAPHALVNTNAWYYSAMKFFDYTSIAYSGKMTREGCGFYPGSSLTTNYGVMNALFGIERIQFESTNPFWCTEFTTMTAVPGSIRKSAYASLLYGNQMVCGWTWQSMHGGEEQYLEGMLDWDGVPNRKYEEYKKIATEFRKIAPYFPYQPKAEIGLVFSFPSVISGGYFPEQHQQQLQSCFDLFAYRNMDTRVVDIARSALDYKLLFLPGVSVMDAATAAKVRDFVQKGGTVVMTGNSSVVDETGKVFSSAHPGLLDDVFGIRVAGYEQTGDFNELSRKGLKDGHLELSFKGKPVAVESSRFEIIETRGAEVLGSITSLDRDYPIVTSNRYGRGRAIYMGLPANSPVLGPLADDLIAALSIRTGPDVPAGVMARQIDDRHWLYLNVSGAPTEIRVKGTSRSLLSDKEYSGSFLLPPYEPDFIELK
jgi:beta-galactosidase